MLDSAERLFDEVRLLWHTLVVTGERVHENEQMTLGMRGVLEFLVRRGPATVPQIAHSRRVTRQHIQSLVNSLLKLDLVQLEKNPAHQRSFLLLLTSKGDALIRRVKGRERRFLASMHSRIKRADLERATAILATVREALEERL
jgi:DNA-binding MarR family transcriptional regulator